MTEELTEQNINHAIDKVAEFIDKIIAPPFKQVGGILEDQVKFWRLKNQVRIAQKAEAYFIKKGIEPKKVPLKILAPLLEYGSLEEEESIQDKWAALLINAADPDISYDLSLVQIDLLRQLTPLEVKILDDIQWKNAERQFLKGGERWPIYQDIDVELMETLNNLNSKTQMDIIKINLQRLNIIEFTSLSIKKASTSDAWYVSKDGNDSKSESENAHKYYLTPLGISFLNACKLEKDTHLVILKKEEE